MIFFENLSSKQKAELKNGVIEISAQHMNRTALGIVDAMFQIYPNLTFDEMKSMLPDTLNPSAPKNYKSLFKPYTERLYGVIQSASIKNECANLGLDVNASHFSEKELTFKTADNIEVLVSRTWETNDTLTKEHDLNNLINHVKKFGVRVVDFKKGMKLTNGGYSLEIVNPVLIKDIQKKNKSFKSLILLVALLGVISYLLLKLI